MRLVSRKKTKIKIQTPRENDLNQLIGENFVSSASWRRTQIFLLFKSEYKKVSYSRF